MSFLYGLHLKNFKIFEGTKNLELSPITILTGSNSCGKSTLNTAINLINHFFSDKIINDDKSFGFSELNVDHLFREINLQDIEKEYADFSSLINYKSTDEFIELGFPILLENFHNETHIVCRFIIKEKLVPTGQLSCLEINDRSTNENLFSIYTKPNEAEKIQIFCKINYVSFYNSFLKDFQKCQNIIENISLYKKENRFNLELNPSTKEDIKSILKKEYGEYEYNVSIDGERIYIDESDTDKTVGYGYDFDEYKKLISKQSLKSFFLFKKLNETKNLLDFSNFTNEELNKIKTLANNQNKTIDDYILQIISNYEYRIAKIDDKGFVSSYVDSNLAAFQYKAFEKEFEKKDINLKEVRENIFITKYRKIYSEVGEMFFKDFVLKQIMSSLNNTKLFQIFHISNYNSINILKDLHIKDHQNIKNFLNISEVNDDLLSFLNKWIYRFGIGDSIKIKRVENRIWINIKKGKRIINLEDLGFGASRIIPLIVNICMLGHDSEFFPGFKDGRILLIEEPELGLHPKNQSLLADFLIDLKKIINVQIIVETHSEYLIRKLQVLVAEEKIMCSDVQLYYLHHPDNLPKGENQMTKINIYQDGSLSKNFGVGFFDEATNLNIALYGFTRDRLN